MKTLSKRRRLKLVRRRRNSSSLLLHSLNNCPFLATIIQFRRKKTKKQKLT
jgi:hypothetical protein